MGLVVVTPPAVEPVDLADVKAQLRVDYADEDALIQAYIRAAREVLERRLWRAFITQTLALVLDEWPQREIRLPRPPLQAVNTVTYTDADGVVYTLDASAYVVDATSEPGRVVLRDGVAWPATALAPAAGVRVEYIAGYGDSPEDVPEAIRLAIRLLAAHWYEHREAVGESKMAEIPLGVWWLVAPYRAARFE